MNKILERRKQMREEWAAKAQQCEWRGDLTIEEIEKHNTTDDCWNIINGDVYDMTQYIMKHPGGSSHFLRDRDISKVFNSFHKGLDISFIEKLKIGRLVPTK